MSTVLDDFDLDIRIGDSSGRPLEMIPPTDFGCDTNIACGTGRTDCVCPTDGSCHQTACC
jgi:hypothetical protein